MKEAESGLESKLLDRVDLLIDGDALENPCFKNTPGDQFSDIEAIRSRFYRLADALQDIAPTEVLEDNELKLKPYDASELIENLAGRFTRYAVFIPKPELEKIMLNQLDALLFVEHIQDKEEYVEKIFALTNSVPQISPPSDGWDANGRKTSMEEFVAGADYCAGRINEIIKKNDPDNLHNYGLKAAMYAKLLQQGEIDDALEAAKQIFGQYTDAEIKEIAELTETIVNGDTILMLKSMDHLRADTHNQSVFGNLVGDNTSYGLEHGLSLEESLDFAENASAVEFVFLKTDVHSLNEGLLNRYRSNLVALTKEYFLGAETHTEIYNALKTVIDSELARIMDAAVDKEIKNRVDSWMKHTDLPEKVVRRKLKKEFSDPEDPSHPYIKAVRDTAYKLNLKDAALKVFRQYGAGLLRFSIDTDFKEDVYEGFILHELSEQTDLNGLRDAKEMTRSHIEALLDSGSFNEAGFEDYTRFDSEAKESGLKKGHRVAYGELALSLGADRNQKTADVLLENMKEAQKLELEPHASMMYAVIKRNNKLDENTAKHSENLSRLFNGPRGYLDVHIASANLETNEQFSEWAEIIGVLSSYFTPEGSAQTAMDLVKHYRDDTVTLHDRIDDMMTYAENVKSSYGMVDIDSARKLSNSIRNQDEGNREAYLETILAIGKALPTNGNASNALKYVITTLNVLAEGGTDAEDYKRFTEDVEEMIDAQTVETTKRMGVKTFLDDVLSASMKCYEAGAVSYPYQQISRLVRNARKNSQPLIDEAVKAGKDKRFIDFLYEREAKKAYNHIVEGIDLTVALNLTGFSR